MSKTYAFSGLCINLDVFFLPSKRVVCLFCLHQPHKESGKNSCSQDTKGQSPLLPCVHTCKTENLALKIHTSEYFVDAFVSVQYSFFF